LWRKVADDIAGNIQKIYYANILLFIVQGLLRQLIQREY